MDQKTMYHRNGSGRVVQSVAQEVKAKFDGYVLDKAPAAKTDVDYRDLQEQAKAAGIPANQSKANLAAAVDASERTVTPAVSDIPTTGDTAVH